MAAVEVSRSFKVCLALPCLAFILVSETKNEYNRKQYSPICRKRSLWGPEISCLKQFAV
jgi:hypothetical protein